MAATRFCVAVVLRNRGEWAQAEQLARCLLDMPELPGAGKRTRSSPSG
ncbi:MAG: hypothetical protein M3R70_05230 [Actinomycetota bacterium]|nr:hypothetical protein [Actinomycetota bacterium]